MKTLALYLHGIGITGRLLGLVLAAIVVALGASIFVSGPIPWEPGPRFGFFVGAVSVWSFLAVLVIFVSLFRSDW